MNILFVCTGNTCRSPMAEGLFKEISKNSSVDFNIHSAGLAAVQGSHATPHAVEACKKEGADISHHCAQNIRLMAEPEKTDLFVVMTNEQAAVLMNVGVPQNKIYVLNVPDPYGGDAQLYRKTCNSIKEKLKHLLQLIEQDKSKNN